MILADVGDLRHRPEAALLEQSRIWTQNIYRLDRMRIRAYYEQMCLRLPRSQVRAAFQVAASECLQAYILGRIDYTPLAHYVPPPLPLQSGDAVELMRSLPYMQRAAVLFALSESLSPDEVERLTRAEAQRQAWSFLGASILRRLPAHIHSRWVFWRLTAAGDPMPLCHLADELKRATGYCWSELREALLHGEIFDSIDTLLNPT